MLALQAHDMTLYAGFERERAVRGRGPRIELTRLGNRAAGELRAADPGRETEIVLDSPRGARLPTQRGALHDQRHQTLRRPIHRGAEPRGATADHDQIDHLTNSQLEPDPQRPRDFTTGGVT